ncbi:MAG: DsrE/DsrF/DrsH-like family protein [Planctomycetaceae bacterium]
MNTDINTTIAVADAASATSPSVRHRPVQQQPHPDEHDLRQLQARVAAMESRWKTAPDPNRMNLLVFEGSRDRLLAAFVMATGAASCGVDVSMFFTFWSTAALRKPAPQRPNKSIIEWCFGWMLPKGLRATRLSQLDMCGAGRLLMDREMRNKNIADLETLIQAAADLGVRINVCEMSMKLMGIQREELIDYPDLGFCGVATFAEMTTHANTTLFI